MVKKNTGSTVAGELSILLADTYALALKTQNYHWNVTGAEFYSLHLLFETQYESLHKAADELAERIRALGTYAPGGFSEFSILSSVSDAKNNITAKAMLKDLLDSHLLIVKQAKKVIALADKHADSATVDLVVGRIEDHEKQAWMLKSSV